MRTKSSIRPRSETSAAAWITASAPPSAATVAAASEMSARRSAPARSMPIGWSPSAASRRQIAPPMNPAAPVTATRTPGDYGQPYADRPDGALGCGAVRRSTALRAAALTVLAAGVAAPHVRRRLRLKPPVVLGAAAAAPSALCVLVPRSKTRDVFTCLLQMFAYITAYKMPYDDPETLVRRVKVGYPVKIDKLLGGGTTPTLRLQRALGTPGHFRPWEQLLVWSHWVWFAFPHGTVLYLILRHPERVNRGAARIYATFDIGLIGYWALPTAPPWYAAAEGRMQDGRTPELGRMMGEY